MAYITTANTINNTFKINVIETIFGVRVVREISIEKGILFFLEDGNIYLQDNINNFIIKEITDPEERLEYAQYRF